MRGVTIMSVEIKTDDVKTRKVDVKISKRNFSALDVYAKSQKTSATKILDKIVTEFLEREDVKKIVQGNSELSKKKDLLKKKKDEISRLESEIAALEVSEKG